MWICHYSSTDEFNFFFYLFLFFCFFLIETKLFPLEIKQISKVSQECCLRMDGLGHRLCEYSLLYNAAELFSEMAMPIYTPTLVHPIIS